LGVVRVFGVDGCKSGWVVVALDGDAVTAVRFAGSLAVLLRDAGPGQVVAIDMPLGLLAEGWRAADRAAGRLLGRRRSSVFAIAPRPVWQEPSFEAANRRCRLLTGNGLSAQAWGLRAKLLEANDYRQLCGHPLYEVHPELSFQAMAGAALGDSKYSPAGHAERRHLLKDAGVDIPDDLLAARQGIRVDILDAAAAAWSAQRIAMGEARVLPDSPQHDPLGDEIAIRY
jgi:predicted RNase H-like nuclease